MNRYRHIHVFQRDDVFCVRLKNARLDEIEIYQASDELLDLCQTQGCRKLALSLGPQTPDCLYSVFLAKLISIRNALKRHDGQFVLCEVSPTAMSIFSACALDREFTFAADYAAASALMNGDSHGAS